MLARLENRAQVARIHKYAGRARHAPDFEPYGMRPAGHDITRQHAQPLPCTRAREQVRVAPWRRIVLLKHNVILRGVHAGLLNVLPHHAQDTIGALSCEPGAGLCTLRLSPSSSRALHSVIMLPWYHAMARLARRTQGEGQASVFKTRPPRRANE